MGNCHPQKSKLAYTKAERARISENQNPIPLYCSSKAFPWPLYVRGSVQAQNDLQSLGTQPIFSSVMLSACGPWHQVLARSLPHILEGPRVRVQLEAPSTQPWIHFALKGIFAPTFHPYPTKGCLQPLLRPTGKLSGGTTHPWMDGFREGLENQLLTTCAGNSEILGNWNVF